MVEIWSALLGLFRIPIDWERGRAAIPVDWD
jgi:hypothetical protein